MKKEHSTLNTPHLYSTDTLGQSSRKAWGRMDKHMLIEVLDMNSLNAIRKRDIFHANAHQSTFVSTSKQCHDSCKNKFPLDYSLILSPSFLSLCSQRGLWLPKERLTYLLALDSKTLCFSSSGFYTMLVSLLSIFRFLIPLLPILDSIDLDRSGPSNTSIIIARRPW